jgi:UrcA family protein
MLTIDTRKMACIGAAGFIGTALVLAAASPVHSQSFSHQPVTVQGHRDSITRIVPYGDLALTSDQGRRILMRRVDAAVTQVCPDFDEQGSVYDVPACQDFAWAGARPQIKRAFDNARSGALVAMSIAITAASK